MGLTNIFYKLMGSCYRKGLKNCVLQNSETNPTLYQNNQIILSGEAELLSFLIDEVYLFIIIILEVNGAVEKLYSNFF